MAFTYGFYNYDKNDSGDSKLYDAQQMSQIFDGIIEDGVYAHVGDRFNVTATGTGVKVGSGRAWFNHTWNYNDSDLTLTAPAAPTTGSRIDAVVIDINANRNARTNTIKWVLGNPASSPVKPTLEHTTLHNQYALAYVTRTAGTSTISDSDISNAVGTDETPYVTGVLESISASQILSDFTAQFNSFITSSTDRVTNLLTEWRYGYRDFIDGCNSEFESALHGYEIQVDDLISQKTTEFNSFLSQKTSDFNSFLNTKTTEFNSFISTKNNDFREFVNTKTAEFSTFLEDCESEFDSFLTNLSSRCDAEIKKYALVAEGYAAGTQDGTPTSIMPYFHNNAKYHADRAKESADKAEEYATHSPYIGANGNWFIWNVTAGEFIDSGVDASITVQIADVSMLATGETPRVTNTGTNTDPVFHLFIPYGVYISSIAKTGTSGLVDTYRINFTNGTNTSFTVTNGKSAYQSAKDGGYSGTEAEFNDELAMFKSYKDSAASSASTATTKASEASTSATNAASSASTATSKATAAATSATNAASSASTASTKASEASTSASNAASSASTASTKASEASSSATSAASSASTASTKANEASSSATTASTKASEASSSATNAASSASTASTKATEASNSAVLSESYAKGGTGTRTGEDTDNALHYKNLAKTYSENAEAVVGIGIATTSRAGIVKPDGDTMSVGTDGLIKFVGISDADWNQIEELLQ